MCPQREGNHVQRRDDTPFLGRRSIGWWSLALVAVKQRSAELGPVQKRL